jgi:hypothetical protein
MEPSSTSPLILGRRRAAILTACVDMTGNDEQIPVGGELTVGDGDEVVGERWVNDKMMKQLG